MISWKINKLTTTTIDNLYKVIIGCEWECVYKTESIFRRSNGIIKFEHSHLTSENYKHFDFITQQNVIDWVKAGLGQMTVDAIEEIQNGGDNVTEEDHTDPDTVWPAYWEGVPADPQYDEWGNLVDSEGNPIDEQGNPL